MMWNNLLMRSLRTLRGGRDNSIPDTDVGGMLMRRSSVVPAVLLAVLVTVAVPALADVLIYSDQSPGSIPLYNAVREAAIGSGQNLQMVSSVPAFTSQIPAQSWTQVIAIYRRPVGEPEFASALRAYVQAGGHAQLFVWHDHGDVIADNVYVTATTAFASWLGGTTAIAYATPGAPPAAAQTGLVFPDFSGVTIEPTQVVASVPPADGESRPQSQVLAELQEQTDPCAHCLTEFNNRKSAANLGLNEDLAICNASYQVTDPAWAACFAEAQQNHADLMRVAVNKYKRCLFLCHIQNENGGNPPESP